MPTAASARYRKKQSRAPACDPQDVIPNLRKKTSEQQQQQHQQTKKSIKSQFPFLRKSSGGTLVTVGLSLAAASSGIGANSTSAASVVQGGSSGCINNGGSAVHHPAPRRDSINNLFDDEDTSEKLSEKLASRLSSSAASVRARAKDAASAFSSFKPDFNERGAAFIANHRSRRRSQSEDSSVFSLSKSKHGINKSSHGRSAGDMKRTSFQKSAFASLKRSFAGNSAMSATESVAASSDASAQSAAEQAMRKYPPLTTFFQSFHHSYLSQLSPETPSSLEKSLALQLRLGGGHPGRPVYNGHYVRVRPTPLTNPKLVIYSQELAKELRLNSWEVESDAFVKYFSGDVDGATADHEGIGEVETWATPYALSIMGRRYTSNVS
jgi:hypothetical protein